MLFRCGSINKKIPKHQIYDRALGDLLQPALRSADPALPPQQLAVRVPRCEHSWLLRSCSHTKPGRQRVPHWGYQHNQDWLHCMLQTQSGSILHSDRNEWVLIPNTLSQPILGTHLLFTFERDEKNDSEAPSQTEIRFRIPVALPS